MKKCNGCILNSVCKFQNILDDATIEYCEYFTQKTTKKLDVPFNILKRYRDNKIKELMSITKMYNESIENCGGMFDAIPEVRDVTDDFIKNYKDTVKNYEYEITSLTECLDILNRAKELDDDIADNA